MGDNESDCLTNLRFADHVLLFATSLEQLQKMMCEFKQSTEKVGRKIHPGKTKILSNQSSNKRREVPIDNIKVEILTKEESSKYLRQTITFQQQETVEIKYRIRAARASFYKYMQELTSKSCFLQHRLRLFNLVITPTMNDASGTWTLSKEHEKNDTIDTAQNAPPHSPNKKKIPKEDTSQQRGKRERKREESGKARRKERRGRNERKSRMLRRRS